MTSLRRAFGKQIPIPIPAELADEATLLAYLGVSAKELKKIWWFRSGMYHQFSIAKRQGKTRIISAPDRRLKMLQRKLLPLLEQLYRRRNPVHGFVPERSVKTNAEAHGSRRFVINLDLLNFFPSITENRVEGLLVAIGVNDRVAEIVARLCCFQSHLPQGAPTSPVLSNMICYRLDTDLMQIAKGARAIYTRYADDITFSSYQPPSPLFEAAVPTSGRFSPELLAPSLLAAISSNGFKINPDKAHYAEKNSRRIVTGVKINAGLNVDRRFVRRVRAVLHSIEKTDLASAKGKYAALGGKGDLSSHLRGKIAYLAYLKGHTDPVVRSLAVRFNKSFPGAAIKLHPTSDEQRERSVWLVEHEERFGTGFFLDGVGLVTAAHCVEGASEVELFHPSKHTTKFKVRVLKRDKDRDLALLDEASIPTTEYFKLPAASHPAAVGDFVSALGYPEWGLVDPLNTRPGQVTVLTTKFGVQLIEVTQELTQGMSGGPILNANGEVVAVIQRGGPNEGRQLAIRLNVLQEWLHQPAATSS